jgi:hypothetical protein
MRAIISPETIILYSSCRCGKARQPRAGAKKSGMRELLKTYRFSVEVFKTRPARTINRKMRWRASSGGIPFRLAAETGQHSVV